MLTTPWKKVLLDLWEHRGRTLIVALAIAVGVYAVGVVLNAREILVREYRRDQVQALVASASIYTAPFEADLAGQVAKLPDIVAAEGRRVVQGRVYLAAGESQEIVLVAVPDFADMQVDRVQPVAGAAEPGRRQVLLENLSFSAVGVEPGDDLTIEMDNDAVRTLQVVGSVHDASMFSPSLSGVAVGYVSPETMTELGYPHTYSELRIRVTDPAKDEAHILAALAGVEDYLESSGRTVFSRTVITEAQADPYIDTIVLILTGFGLVILLLSGFLVVNAMTALITQQIPQIGVMKLIGARRGQVMALYLVMVLVYGLLAVAAALPLAALTARLLMVQVVEPLLNVQIVSYAVPLPLLGAQAAVGLLLPLLAGLAPVLRGTRISTQEALNDVGLAKGTGSRGRAGRWTRVQRRRVSSPVILAVRNTLRHRGRLVQTLVVLIFGTALFISVLSVRASVNKTLDSFMRFHRYDVSIQLEQPELIVRLMAAAEAAPGVEAAEVWSAGSAQRVREVTSGSVGDRPEQNDPPGPVSDRAPVATEKVKSDAFSVVAVPVDTAFMAPELLDGRWLSADIPNAVVINSDLLDDERDLGVGRDVVLEIAGREATWHIVGVVSTESRGATVYVNRDDYAYITRTPGQGTRLQVRGVGYTDTGQSGETQQTLAGSLYEQLDALGLKVSATHTTLATQTENRLLFTVVVAFLILMALLLAAVGGLGLTTTMSINIMERVREIGVLRAIGASNESVRGIVVAEGLVIALLSWLVGTALSLFISPLFSELLGLALIKIPLRYTYSAWGALAWLVILALIALAATLGPARNAVRLTVREVLSYE